MNSSIRVDHRNYTRNAGDVFQLIELMTCIMNCVLSHAAISDHE